ncbi:MAG: GTP cyclohydrolase I FolE [Pseudomonadota bacterium]
MSHTVSSVPRGSKLETNIPKLAESIFLEIGEDPKREGLLKTPERFYKAIQHLTSGYGKTASEVIGEGIFNSESSGLVCVKDIEFYSLCEHHMLPFWGKASIAYYPNQKILGLSKLARIVDLFSKRLQVQERFTKEVAETVYSLVDARAAAVVVEAQHMCMMMRGVQKQSSMTRTEFSLGVESISALELERIWKQFEK